MTLANYVFILTPALANVATRLITQEGLGHLMLSMTLSIMLITVPINAVVSIGEELGWRAYLLPKLIKLMQSFAGPAAEEPAQGGGLGAGGGRRAALLVGLIHGAWHWPLFLMSIRIDSGSTFPFPLVYLVFTCSLSVLLCWGALRSGSVWPAAVGHGTLNATSVLPAYLQQGPALPLLGPAPTGLIGGLGYLLLALALLFSRKALAVEKEYGFLLKTA